MSVVSEAVVLTPPEPPVEELCAAAANNDRANHLEALMAGMPQMGFKVEHTFTPGLYARKMYVPAGSFVSTKIHKQEHQYAIVQGDIAVWTKDDGVVRLKAPHTGITKPGTRRFAFAHEDTIWVTFHPTEETDLDRLEAQLIYPHVTPEALPGGEDVFAKLQEALK